MTLLNILLEITIYSAVLFGAIWLFRILLKKQLSPVMLYAIWFILIARLLMPVTIASRISFFTVPTVDQPTAYSESVDLTGMLDKTAAPTQNAPYNATQAVQQQEALNEQMGQSAEVQSDTTAKIRSKLNITWEMALIALWLAGIAVMLIQIGISVIQLRKRIKSAQTVPTQWQQIAEELQTELGLKRSVRLVMIAGFPSPALCGGISPVIVLPSEMIGKSEESIRFALLHEMTHIKRGDHIVSMLLLLLRAVYWFNPIVWLMMKQMRLDIETACDSCLTKLMSTSTKKRYAGTMLSMYAQQQIRYVLGMSMGQTKKTAERRLRGMYMRRRSSRKSKMIAILLTTVLLVTCFTTACQPTPEKPIVQSKDNDSVAQAIAQSQVQESDQTAEINKFSAPNTWQGEAHDENKNIDIYIDANVDVPTDTWGLYELVPKTPTQEDVQRMLTAIVGDATIYGEETIKSKEYLLEQITRLEWQKEEFERLLNNEGGVEPILEDENLAQEVTPKQTPPPAGEEDGPSSISMLSKEDLQRNIQNFSTMIAEAKEKLKTAPEKETVVQNEFVLTDMFKEDITAEQAIESGMSYHKDGANQRISLRGTVDLGRDTPADISIEVCSGDYTHFSLHFTDYDDYEQGFFSGVAYTGQELLKCDINAEDAANIARAKVAEMGFDYLDINTTMVCEMMDRKRKEGEKFPECYEFVFTRSMDGATATFARGSGIWTEAKELALQYAPHWGVGEVTVRVDDSGVIGITVNTLKSDAVRQAYGIELMDFEEIMAIFNKQVFIENTYEGPGDMDKVAGREIHVTEIQLGYMPTAWKDHPGQIIFTPVWDFFGEEITTFEGEIPGDLGEALDDNNQYSFDLGNQSLLTINALDGTIMIRQ